MCVCVCVCVCVCLYHPAPVWAGRWSSERLSARRLQIRSDQQNSCPSSPHAPAEWSTHTEREGGVNTMWCHILSSSVLHVCVFWSTFFIAVVFLTLGISLSFPLLTRGALEQDVVRGGCMCFLSPSTRLPPPSYCAERPLSQLTTAQVLGVIFEYLEKCVSASVSQQWMLCSEWVPSEWESKQLIKTSQ